MQPVSAALQKGAALPCDMERLVEVGRRHGVAVIEVAACAIGSDTPGASRATT